MINKCSVCGEAFEGDEVIDVCPDCLVKIDSCPSCRVFHDDSEQCEQS